MSKKKKHMPPPLSPKKYIITRAQTLPVHKCLINQDWDDSRMASIVVMRKHTNGNITAGFYLVDLLARGVKDTHFIFNEPEWQVMERILDQAPEDFYMETTYVLVHNIIYSAVAFAEEYDMKPHEDFNITRHLLEEDTDDVEWVDITCGVDGEPDFLFDDDTILEDNEEVEPLFDFDEFTDDDWRGFLNSQTEVSNMGTTVIIDGLFRRWLDKHQPASDDHQLEALKNIRVTHEPLVSYYKDEQERKELEELYYELNNPLHGKWNITSIEKRIHQMITRNPDNPISYNYLAICAQLEGNHHKYKTICESTVLRFPDYLVGNMMWVNLLIDEQRMNEVPGFLNNNFHIRDLYPSREIFHISELKSFFGTMIRYFVKTGALRLAQDYSDVILDLDADDEPGHVSNILQKSQDEFIQMKGVKILAYLNELDVAAPGFMKIAGE